MRGNKFSVAMLAVLGVVAAVPAAADQVVTAAAVWHPAAGFMADFHGQCDGHRGVAFDTCFAAAMAQSGASAAALAFTKQLDNQAYLQALEPTAGPVAIAHAVYPFRANENDAWLLVNGTPPLIDVDDQQDLPLARMRASPSYIEIRHHYPNVTFWPGDRGRSGPEVLENGREIIVGYLLRDLCHACAIVGRARYAFDFDADGKFLGTRFVSVIPALG